MTYFEVDIVLVVQLMVDEFEEDDTGSIVTCGVVSKFIPVE